MKWKGCCVIFSSNPQGNLATLIFSVNISPVFWMYREEVRSGREKGHSYQERRGSHCPSIPDGQLDPST